MWNRTGLPAVFPLQIKTPPGQDYVVTLLDAESGEAALAGYVKGGAFFKVLVPPGVFRLRFATGEVWQGEKALFGPGHATRVFELQTALTFETRGLGVKAGHVVDVVQDAPGQGLRIALRDQLICQSFRPNFTRPQQSGLQKAEIGQRPPNAPPRLPGTEMTAFDWHRSAKTKRFENRHLFDQMHDPIAPDGSVPVGRDVRSRFCD